ncbi:MAG TPA: DUF998 domain-containing protein [Thermomicrobiales bacterium]|nr:DUF998 domain-containing protein [Thermomicrobiales bacterium]
MRTTVTRDDRGVDRGERAVAAMIEPIASARAYNDPSGPPPPTALTRALLRCGAVAGPLFVLVVLVQDYTRPGVDPRTQPLSLLALGAWGWVQVANFALVGALNLLYAAGLWRRLHPGRAGTWGPLLIGIYGLGLVVVGVCRTDPAAGFPPDVAAATQPSWHGAVHALGALVTFLALTAALAVFARRFLARREWWWAAYCLASATLQLALFFGGFVSTAAMARTLRLAVLVGWTAASAIAAQLLAAPDAARRARGR